MEEERFAEEVGDGYVALELQEFGLAATMSSTLLQVSFLLDSHSQ